MIRDLNSERKKLRKAQDDLLLETKRILIKEKFNEKNILDNLKEYNRSFEVLSEDECDGEYVFTIDELKSFSIKNRLRFINSQDYTGEYPYECVLKIKDYNKMQRKDLRHFKVLCFAEHIKSPSRSMPCALFVKTDSNNYFLLHHWGGNVNYKRKLFYLPIRNFETAFATLLVITGLITLIIPNKYLSTDIHVGYFSMYRAACFFHVLIIVIGFFVFRMIAGNIQLSSSCWNQHKI